MVVYNNDPDLIKTIQDLSARLDKLERANPLQRATVDISNSAVAQDAGLKVIDGKTGLVQFELGGTVTPRRPDGTPQPFFRLKRDDGTVALELIDRDPLDAGGYQQYLALYDRQGNKIFGDDINSGFGLAYPYIHYAVYHVGSIYNWQFSSVGDAFVGGITICSPRISVTALAYIIQGTPTGGLQVTIDGVVVGAMQGFTSNGQISWTIDVSGYALNSLHTLAIQITILSGAGVSGATVGVRPLDVRSNST